MRRYDLLCIEHPHFACPDLSRVDLERKPFDSDARKFISYEYFVSFLAYACEEIHGVYGHEPDWMDSILDELDWHAEYLTSDYFADLSPNYGSRHKEHYIGNEAVRDPAASDVTSRSG